MRSDDYHLSDADLRRIINEVEPATELGWTVKDLMLAHYVIEGLEQELCAIKDSL